jgi:integrase
VNSQFRKKYILFKRARKKGHIWYYRLAGEKTGYSTGESVKWKAIEHVEAEILPELERPGRISLGQYLEPYFVWDLCPHIRRLRTEGKSISPQYAHAQRRRIEMYLQGDPICDISIGDLKRADILDYRDRLHTPREGKRIGDRTANCTMGALKTALREAYFREEIDRDPTVGIGEIKYEETEVGVFTIKEMRELFRKIPGAWRDLSCYVAFILAAQAGLRRGEVLALIWGQIDFESSFIGVTRAMTDNGLPKWNKIRGTPITSQCCAALLELRHQSDFVLPHQHVICNGKTGNPRSETWWKKRFERAMESAGIDRTGRNLRPHSFRHTLNTELRGAGADPSRLRESLGWSNEQVQQKYTHWHPEHFEEQRKIMNKLFE